MTSPLLFILILCYYDTSYEERACSLETVVTKHKATTTYEDFIARVYSPVASINPFSGTLTGGSGDGPSSSNNHSMLAAALLDSHSHKIGQRDQKFRGKLDFSLVEIESIKIHLFFSFE